MYVRIFCAFTLGDVGVSNLDGRIQPILGDDISRLIHALCFDFRPGTYNLPGPEVMSWYDFLSSFQDIVGGGALVRVASSSIANDAESAFAFYRRNFQIGRASCRERVCQYVWITVVPV